MPARLSLNGISTPEEGAEALFTALALPEELDLRIELAKSDRVGGHNHPHREKRGRPKKGDQAIYDNCPACLRSRETQRRYRAKQKMANTVVVTLRQKAEYYDKWRALRDDIEQTNKSPNLLVSDPMMEAPGASLVRIVMSAIIHRMDEYEEGKR